MGKTQQFGTLLHYGRTPVTQDLPAWFHRYNARQTIEAGIKEGKGVFQMHHLKVHSALGIALQEQLLCSPPILSVGQLVGSLRIA